MLGKRGVVDGLQFRQCKQHVRGESRTRLVTGICLQVLQQFGELRMAPEDFDLPGNIGKTQFDRLVVGAVFDHFVNPLADDAGAWTSNGALRVVSAKYWKVSIVWIGPPGKVGSTGAQFQVRPHVFAATFDVTLHATTGAL